MMPGVRKLLGAGPLLDTTGALGRIVRSQTRAWPAVVALGLVAILLAPDTAADLPEPFATLINFADAGSPASTIAMFGVVIMMAVIMKTVLQAANSLLIARIDVSIARRLINTLADRILALDYTTYLRAERARLLHVLSTDSWEVAEAVRSGLSILPALAGLLLFGAILLWLDPVLLGAVAVAALGLWLILRLIERRQRVLGAAANADNRALGWRMLSLVEGLRTVRLFGETDNERARFRAATGQTATSVLAVGRLAALTGPLSELLLAGLFLLVLFTGIALDRPAPTLAAFLLILLRTYPYAAALSQARVEMAARHGAMAETEWLLGQAQEDEALGDAECTALTGAVELRGVSYAYPGRRGALHDVNCTIPPGASTALIGPTGAGKSTLVMLLARLTAPDSGAILHDSAPAEAIPPHQWRARMAYAGQDIALIEGTVRENIAFGSDGAAEADLLQAAADAGAAAMIKALPQGYDTPLGPGGNALSGGQRQRIALARALLRRPDILVLDEATSAIDAPSESEIVALLKRRAHFHTAIVISHRQATLKACTHGIVLNEGRVAESGPVETLAYFQHPGTAAQ